MEGAGFEEVAGFGGGFEEGLDLLAQLGLFGAGVAEEGSALGDGELAGDFEEHAHPAPLFGGHVSSTRKPAALSAAQDSGVMPPSSR